MRWWHGRFPPRPLSVTAGKAPCCKPCLLLPSAGAQQTSAPSLVLAAGVPLSFLRCVQGGVSAFRDTFLPERGDGDVQLPKVWMWEWESRRGGSTALAWDPWPGSSVRNAAAEGMFQVRAAWENILSKKLGIKK